MKIFYYSLTGQVNRFCQKLKHKSIRITEDNSMIETNDNFILIVPSYSMGMLKPVRNFLNYQKNYSNCIGVIGSGNRNFNKSFGHSAEEISKAFSIPLLRKFEFHGNDSDVDFVTNFLSKDTI